MKSIRALGRRSRALWLMRVRPGWHAARPFIVIGLVATVMVLGTVGWQRVPREGPDYGFWDSVFRMLRLFGFEGVIEPRLPWQLLVAGIIGPILTVYAAVVALLSLSREQAQLLRIRFFYRDHVVIAGLGEIGARLALAFYDEHRPVVAVEVDDTAVQASGCLERGVPVVVGNAADPQVLRNIGVDRARHLIVTCGEDGANLDVAQTARDLARASRRRPLEVIVHLSDLSLWQALSAEAVADVDSAVRFEFFNVSVAAMRSLVERHPPFRGADGSLLSEPCIGIVGFDDWGQNLLLDVAQLWRAEAHGSRVGVVITGPHAAERLEDFISRHPEIVSICEIEGRSANVGSAVLQSGEVLLDEQRQREVSCVYVCLPRPADTLSVSLGLRQHLTNTALVAVLPDVDTGVARALEVQAGGPANVEVFAVASAVLRPEVVLHGMTEMIARAKHAGYVRAEKARGLTELDNPSLVEWEKLPESLRGSNRRFAQGVGAALRAAGCVVVPSPLIDPHGSLLEFSAAECEALGRAEHDRWVRDLVRDGWRHTDGAKDPERKLHPLLVPWEELDEPTREKDRAPMRELPEMLARAGLEVRRIREPRADQVSTVGR